MGETLYRKYRPQRFADVQGQVGLIQTLVNQVATGRLAHAYLFSGMRGTGKTTTARLLAKAANCQRRPEKSAEPCGECPSCQEIAAGRSVDVMELDAATHTGVDNVRTEIIENARFLPTRDKFKIFIIDEVHMLSTSSFNALLKSLEEPPAHVIYILATTELHKVPATVASRCQRFIFRPLAAAVMSERIKQIAAAEGVTVDPEVIHRLLVSSGGAMRDAESLLGQMFALGAKEITPGVADLVLPPTYFSAAGEFLQHVSDADATAAFLQLETLLAQGVDLQLFHDTLLRRAHEILLVSVTNNVPSHLGIFSDEEVAALRAWGKKMSPTKVAQILESLLVKRALYKTVASPILPLHLVVVSCLGTPPSSAPPPNVAPPPAPAAPRPPVAVVSPSPISAPRNVPASPPLTLDEVTNKWTTCIQAIVAAAPSLSMMLNNVQIKSVAGRTITLEVSFPLHKAKLSEARTKNLVEQKMQEFYGAPVLCVFSIPENKSIPPTAPQPNPTVADALATFGGQVVE